MDDLVSVWSIWAEGGKPTTLWGVEILWWGRIGNIIQFVGALMVIAELIGPERLSEFFESAFIRVRPKLVLRLPHFFVIWLLAIAFGFTFLVTEMANTFTCPPSGSPFCIFSGLSTILVWVSWSVVATLAVPFLSIYSVGAVAGLLRHASTEKPFKVLSIVFVIVGFHFSLLAS